MANSLAGEVPFPPAGDGIVIRYTLANLAEMASKYQDPRRSAHENDKAFWRTMLEGIQTMNPIVIMDCLRYGLKKAGSTKPLSQDYLEDPPFTLEEAVNPILNALMIRRDGKSFDDQVKEISERMAAEAAAAEIRENEGLPQSPTQTKTMESPTSSESSASATGQA